MSFNDERACDDPHTEMSEAVAAIFGNIEGTIEEDVELVQVCEDCWELTFTDKSGRDDTVQLDDAELQELADLEPLVQAAWTSYVQASNEVAAESYAERRQMGMCDF
jgi:hypothetical protein